MTNPAPEKTSNGNIIIQASEWDKQAGCYAFRVIVWMRAAGNFVTHIQVKREDGTTFLEHGDYDMTIAEAAANYEMRCKRYNVNPYPVLTD